MLRTLVILLIVIFQVSAQNPYPQDYFRKPLDITLVLSGTFAELRSNHFHSGLDIKTQQREGLKVYAAAAGHVSRIKISHWGYGKALYITHPNGYTTVYAHLQKFGPKIEAYIKKLQYQKESFEIEVFPELTDLLVEKGEVVAYSGNTGGSGGPHLHFEIRDKSQRPINPMLFGIDIKDTRSPLIQGVYAYPMEDNAHVNLNNEKTKLRLVPLGNGDFTVEGIKAFGKIGFGVVSYDQQDLAANKNGVNNIQTFFNGNKNFEIDFKRFSFNETKHLNRLIDYEHYKKHKSRIQKLFVESNNPLSMYKEVINNGYVMIEDSTSSVYKVRINDYKGNESWVTIPITGVKANDIKRTPKKTTEHYIFADQALTLKKNNVSVFFPKNTFYDNFFIDFDVLNDTLTLHEATIPVLKNFSINFDISNYLNEDKDKLFIARKTGYKDYLTYSSTTKKGNTLTTRTKTLGTYTLATDTESPKITALNFQDGKWLSKYRYLKLKIKDDLSGIRSYRATINGKWILMEYDYKKNTLVYDFNDKVTTDTNNKLKVIVTDNVGNSSTFEATFFRK